MRNTQPSSVRRYSLAVFLAASAWMSTVLADGLPGEYLVSQRWRDVYARYSPLTNPAFMTEENYLSGRGVYTSTLQGEFSLWEVGATLPIGLYQSAGLTWLGMASGSYQGSIYSNRSTSGLAATNDIASQSDVYMLSYALQPWNRLSVGANMSFVYERLFDKSEWGTIADGAPVFPGIDLGVTYRMQHPLLGYHLFGLDVQNMIPLTVGGDVYSRDLRISWLGLLYENRIEGGIDFNLKDFMAQAGSFTNGGSARVEYEWSLRVGGWIYRMIKLGALAGVSQGGDGRFGLWAGMNVPSINKGRDLEALYQFTSLGSQAGVSSHSLYTRAQFGPHREEMYARMCARMYESSPSDLYTRALGLYYKGEYWDASFVFGQIVSQYPDFFKNDWCWYYFRSCQEKLDMRTPAAQGYLDAASQYRSSEAAPYADLGALRVFYRDGADSLVAAQFAKINRPETPDSLLFQAHYYAGESRMRAKDYAKAIELLSAIPDLHPAYPFAQHSAAICRLLLSPSDSGADFDEALASLNNAVAYAATTPDQAEIVNRSYLLMGYLYYEQGLLSRAVLALRRVLPASMYYPDALLGLSWTAIKAQRWDDCAAQAETLLTVAKEPILQCEARLLKSYGLIRQKRFADAVADLKQAQAEIQGIPGPARDSLDQLRKAYDVNRAVYDSVGAASSKMALGRRTSTSQKMIDNLHSQQQAGKQKIDAFVEYADAFARSSFFRRSTQRVREDIDYALATAVERSGSSLEPEGVAKARKSADEIDKEIDKLKRQMQELEKKKAGEKQRGEAARDTTGAVRSVKPPAPVSPQKREPLPSKETKPGEGGVKSSNQGPKSASQSDQAPSPTGQTPAGGQVETKDRAAPSVDTASTNEDEVVP